MHSSRLLLFKVSVENALSVNKVKKRRGVDVVVAGRGGGSQATDVTNRTCEESSLDLSVTVSTIHMCVHSPLLSFFLPFGIDNMTNCVERS